MRVLLADDDPITRLTIGRALRSLGYQVSEVADGVRAWELIQQDFHPLLVSDWQMPQLSGVDLIRQVRASTMPGYVYCILLTAREAIQDRIAGLDSGADDYLVKPVSRDELRARMQIGTRIIGLEQQLREANARLQYQATHDGLTGLPNRSALIERTTLELDRRKRTGSPLCMAIFDIDHFKLINDRYGHLTGDQVLRHVAQVFQENLRAYDIIGRWGGEEFLLLLPDTQIEEAEIIAQRICRCICDQPLQHTDDETIQLTMSAGVAEALPFSHNESIFARADSALYSAKSAGRNRVALNRTHERSVKAPPKER
ncbi:MAG: diguanylate cyclase [Oscillochloris sp.]|nr:diguanylate cyclase [Oscillochloris sp.]